MNGMSGGDVDRPVVGLTGLWHLSENVIGLSFWYVRFQFFRTVTNDTLLPLPTAIRSAVQQLLRG